MLAINAVPKYRAVVVAQLVERSLPMPEVHSLNPVIGKIYIEHLFTVNCIENNKNKENETKNWPFLIKECVPMPIFNPTKF